MKKGSKLHRPIDAPREADNFPASEPSLEVHSWHDRTASIVNVHDQDAQRRTSVLGNGTLTDAACHGADYRSNKLLSDLNTTCSVNKSITNV